MTLSVDWANKVVHSDASITDLPVAHGALRDLEAGSTGMLYPVVHTYKRIDLGGGAYFHAVDFINGYTLEFDGVGPYQIAGNLNCTINDTGVQVERKTSAAFATTAQGGSGPSAADIAAAILAAAQITPIHSHVKQVNNVTLAGGGTPADPMRPA